MQRDETARNKQLKNWAKERDRAGEPEAESAVINPRRPSDEQATLMAPGLASKLKQHQVTPASRMGSRAGLRWDHQCRQRDSVGGAAAAARRSNLAKQPPHHTTPACARAPPVASNPAQPRAGFAVDDAGPLSPASLRTRRRWTVCGSCGRTWCSVRRTCTRATPGKGASSRTAWASARRCR